MNIDTFDDSMLQHLSRLGQGHFGIVELCTYETDPLMRPGFNELVAVKRYISNYLTTKTNMYNQFTRQYENAGNHQRLSKRIPNDAQARPQEHCQTARSINSQWSFSDGVY